MIWQEPLIFQDDLFSGLKKTDFWKKKKHFVHPGKERGSIKMKRSGICGRIYALR